MPELVSIAGVFGWPKSERILGRYGLFTLDAETSAGEALLPADTATKAISALTVYLGQPVTLVAKVLSSRQGVYHNDPATGDRRDDAPKIGDLLEIGTGILMCEDTGYEVEKAFGLALPGSSEPRGLPQETLFGLHDQEVELQVHAAAVPSRLPHYPRSLAFQIRCRTPLPLSTVLYHGTSSFRVQEMLRKAMRMRVAETGAPKISWSTSLTIAKYWAGMAADVDRSEAPLHSPRQAEGRLLAEPVILSLTLGALYLRGHFLTHHSDPCFGVGECDGEQEIACWSPIRLDEVDFKADFLGRDVKIKRF